MAFKQVKPQKGYEMVMNQIKQRIVSGELAPGAKMESVVDLAASFGVGRSTIREALSALKAMGWVDIRQGGGTYVADELPKEPAGSAEESILQRAESLREILEVRKVLETGCAALAARHRTDEDVRELDAILRHMEAHLADEARGEEADVRFHLAIARATHNTLLLQLMESVSQRLHESMKESRRLWFYGERAEAQRLLQEHSQIVDAIRDGDEAAAYDTMMRHLQKVENVLQRVEHAP